MTNTMFFKLKLYKLWLTEVCLKIYELYKTKQQHGYALHGYNGSKIKKRVHAISEQFR